MRIALKCGMCTSKLVGECFSAPMVSVSFSVAIQRDFSVYDVAVSRSSTTICYLPSQTHYPFVTRSYKIRNEGHL